MSQHYYYKRYLIQQNELNISKLQTDASITAKPFFEKHGFKTVQQQTVKIKDVELINYKMEKLI